MDSLKGEEAFQESVFPELRNSLVFQEMEIEPKVGIPAGC